jgi:hypothetical protein
MKINAQAFVNGVVVVKSKVPGPDPGPRILILVPGSWSWVQDWLMNTGQTRPLIGPTLVRLQKLRMDLVLMVQRLWYDSIRLSK